MLSRVVAAVAAPINIGIGRFQCLDRSGAETLM